jgi:hypothetical protein
MPDHPFGPARDKDRGSPNKVFRSNVTSVLQKCGRDVARQIVAPKSLHDN